MQLKKSIALAAGLVAASLLAGCATGESEAGHEVQPAPGVDMENKTILVGAYGPKTGESTVFYQGLLGAYAYFDAVNDQGGIDGWTIKYVDRDDQYNPSKTTLAARQLVEQDQVFAIVNGTGTSQTKAILPYMERVGIPNVAPAAGGDIFEEAGFKKNFFPATPSFRLEAQFLTEYALNDLGATSVSLFYRNDAVGLPAVPGFEAAAGDKAAAAIAHPATETNFAGYAQQLKDSGADAVVVWSGGPQLVGLQKASAAIGYEPTWLAAWFAATEAYFELGGQDGAYFDNFQVPPSADTPGAQTYRDNLTKYQPDAIVGGTTQQGYMNAEIFVEAVRRMLDKTDTPSWEALIEALETFDDFDTSMAEGITYTADSRVGVGLESIVRAEDGKFVVVETGLPLPVD